MKTSLHAYLFGTFEIHQDNTPISLPRSTQARSLLAYLCLNYNQPITRSILAGTFWPEQSESTARRSLSQALWHIRRALPGLIASDAHIVQIATEKNLWTDVSEFRSQINALHPKEAQALHQAIKLYRGDLLSGYYDEWIFIERELLREQYLQILELSLKISLSKAEYANALDYGHKLIQADPFRESAYRFLMQINLALGRPEAAAKIFKDCQHILQNELGIPPEEETLSLAREIQTRSDTARRPYLPPNLSSTAPLLADEPKELPLVGREGERLDLVSVIDGIFEKRGGLLLVEGNAGIGKTRLLQEAVRDADWRGAQTLWGSCQEIEGVIPYQALVAAIRAGLSLLRVRQLVQLVDKIWLQVLSFLIPELAAHLEDAIPAELTPERTSERLNTAFIQLLTAWAQITPLLLVIEDIHWADADLMEILSLCAARLRNQGVLLIASYRSEDVRTNAKRWQQIQNIDRGGVRGRVLLNGLDAQGSSELVRRALCLANPAPIFEERLHQGTAGNPLFLLETLRSLLEENVLTQDDNGNWHTPWDETTADYGELPTPPAVEAVITRRLQGLEAPFDETLYLGAVIGEYFDFQVLQAVSGKQLAELLPVLSELVRRRFLLETDAQYGFSHARVREVVYGNIDPHPRREYHRQVGEALEQQAPDQTAQLAHHFYQARLWKKNLEYSRLAGDQAAGNYANHEALGHYTRALELIPVEYVSESYAILLAREKIFDLLGDRTAQTQDLEALYQLALQSGQEQQKIEVALRQSKYAESTGNYAEAIDAAQTAVEIAQQVGFTTLAGQAFMEAGRGHWRQGSYPTAHAQFQQALEIAQKTSLRALEADALNNLGNVCLYQGDYSQAKEYYQQTLPLYRELGNRQGEGNVTYNLGYVIHDMGDVEAASRHYLAALDIYREIGFQRGVASAHNIFGITQQDLGNFPEARIHFEQAERLFREINDQQSRAQAIANIGVVWMNLGQYAKARPYFEQGLQIQHELGDRRGAGAMQASLSAYFNYQKEYAAAKTHASQACAIFDELGDLFHQGFALTYLGNAHFGLGDLEAAAQAYEQALAVRRASEQANRATGSLADLARVALAQADFSQALDYAEQILQYLENGTLDGCDDPLQIYLTCYHALQANDDPRAAEILETGHTQLQERAACIDDEAMRRSFLDNISYHQELAAAYQAWQDAQSGSQTQARLPKIEAPTGRPLREDEWVEITWTPHKPEDEKISHKGKQRQHRLLRLLGEAAAQGGAPTVEDLSQVLGVSIPTIKRDLAALRKAGHKVQTRGSRTPP